MFNISNHNHSGNLGLLTILHQDVIQESLRNRFNQVLDLITYRIENQSIEQLIEQLMETMFELRVEVLVSMEGLSFNEYQKILTKEYIKVTQLKSISQLYHTMSMVLDNFQTVSLAIGEKLNLESIKFNRQIAESMSYQVLDFLENWPYPSNYIMKWLKESIRLETAMMIADMVFNKKISLDVKRIQELILFLEQSMMRYGAYAIVTRVWVPSEYPYKIVDDMRILARAIDIENRPKDVVSISSNQLKELLLV